LANTSNSSASAASSDSSGILIVPTVRTRNSEAQRIYSTPRAFFRHGKTTQNAEHAGQA